MTSSASHFVGRHTRLRIDEFEDRAIPALTGLRGMFLLSSSYFSRPGITAVARVPVATTPVRPVVPVQTPVTQTPITQSPVSQTPLVNPPTGIGNGAGTPTRPGTGIGTPMGSGTTIGIGTGGGTSGTGVGTVTAPGVGTTIPGGGIGSTTGTTGIGTAIGSGLGGTTPVSPVVPPLLPVGTTGAIGTAGLPGSGVVASGTGIPTIAGLPGTVGTQVGLPSAPTNLGTTGTGTFGSGPLAGPVNTLPTSSAVPTSTTDPLITNLFPTTPALSGTQFSGSATSTPLF